MESTGCPGKVHITGQTLALLEGEYIYDDGTEAAKKDPTLIQNNIQTYLIGRHYYLDNAVNYFLPPVEMKCLEISLVGDV